MSITSYPDLLTSKLLGELMSLQKIIMDEFQELFGDSPSTIVRAPGRVNLIGEHTDYNDGFVLPMAINRAAWIALRPRSDRQVSVYSPYFKQTIAFSLDVVDTAKSGWIEYIRGMAWALQQSGNILQGWEGVMLGDVPVGAGLSSSAALELATARAFAAISALPWDAATMAKLGQKTENQWVGVNCGIMDQMISAAGKSQHALLIDCRSLQSQLVPLPPDTAVVILDTATRRGLGDTAYNERRARCEEAARFFGVPALRDVTLEQYLKKLTDWIDYLQVCSACYQRKWSHITGGQAMRQGDAAELGQLMQGNHVSLRDDFEVSSDALNMIVDAAMQENSCFGARMTGGGFGGCAVALVRARCSATFAENVAGRYHKQSGIRPSVYVCEASNGAEVKLLSR